MFKTGDISVVIYTPEHFDGVKTVGHLEAFLFGI